MGSEPFALSESFVLFASFVVIQRLNLTSAPSSDNSLERPNAERGGQLDPQPVAAQSIDVLIGSPSFIAGK